MNKAALTRRAKSADQLSKQLNLVFKNLDKIPSFTGKAAFMDKVIKAYHMAGSLSVNLKADLEELK